MLKTMCIQPFQYAEKIKGAGALLAIVRWWVLPLKRQPFELLIAKGSAYEKQTDLSRMKTGSEFEIK